MNFIVNIPVRILVLVCGECSVHIIHVCVFNGMNALQSIESNFFVERGRLLPDCFSVLDE